MHVTAQPAAIFAQAPLQSAGIHVGVGHESHAREGQDAIARGIELLAEVVVADGASALHGRVQPAQTEVQADEADRGEDVEEHAECGQSHERRNQEHQVGGDEDVVDLVGRFTAEEGKRGQQQQQRRQRVLEPRRGQPDRASRQQRLGGFRMHLDARHQSRGRGLGIVQSGRGVAHQHGAARQRGQGFGWRATDGPAREQVGGANEGQLAARAPVDAHAVGKRRHRVRVAAGGQAQRHRCQRPITHLLVQRHVAQHAIASARDVQQRAVFRHRLAIGQQQRNRRIVARVRHQRIRRRCLRSVQRRTRVVVRVQSGRAEDEAARPAFGDGIEGGVAQRVLGRRVGELHVESDRAHTGAIEGVDQVRMQLPAPRPTTGALLAHVLDRALVDLDHDHLARWLGFPRAETDDLVEDRILGGSELAFMLPVPGQPSQRTQRQQREEGVAQAQRDQRVHASIALLHRAPEIDERVPEPRHCGFEQRLDALEDRFPQHAPRKLVPSEAGAPGSAGARCG